MNAMNPSQPTPDLLRLEAQLAALTRAPGEPTALWRAALDSAARPGVAKPAARQGGSLWHREVSLLGLLGVAAVLCLIIGVMLPSLGKARRAARVAPGMPTVQEQMLADWRDRMAYGMLPESRDLDGAELARATEGRQEDTRSRAPSTGGGRTGQPVATDAPPIDRHVIRKVTLELTVADVHAAFLKAQLLVSDATGEYVEASTLSGDGDRAQGSLTLRVAASRLSEVLNQLRPLGQVRTEQQTGEDVTAAVVDIEARLRNERRVEQELLELLDTRADAPLNDVLTLRSRIAEVRDQIERLDAQRERFSRLTSLATILVILRAAREEDRASSQDLAIGKLFADAWSGGVSATIQTLATIVRILVGGAVWWILLLVAAVVVRRRMHRTALLEGRIG